VELGRDVFNGSNLLATVDSLAGLLSEAQARNFDRWPILGTYVWPNAYIGQTHGEEIEHMKQWIADRRVWLDALLSPDDVAPGEGGSGVPRDIVLEQNYPNPFNSSSEIAYRIPEAGRVRLALYDLLGREVRVLVDHDVRPGVHRVRVEADDLASGVYLYRLSVRPADSGGGRGSGSVAGAIAQAKRLVILR